MTEEQGMTELHVIEDLPGKMYLNHPDVTFDEIRRINWLMFVGSTDKISPDKWIDLADACAKFCATGESAGQKLRVVK